MGCIYEKELQGRYRQMAGRSAGYQHDTWTDNRLSGDRWGSEWGNNFQVSDRRKY